MILHCAIIIIVIVWFFSQTGQRPVSPEQNGRNVQNPMVFSYSVLNYETGYGEEEEAAVTSLSFSEEHFTPRHGVRAPLYDFSEFNRTRVASGSTSKVRHNTHDFA